ncbi:POC1 centriolar protein A, partial [Ceratobasidium sp. 370]
WGRKRVASLQYKVSAVEDQGETKIDSENSKYTATIVFSNPQLDEAAAATALARAQEQAANRQLALPDHLGQTHEAINTILEVVKGFAGLTPTSEAAFNLCTAAWKKLEVQGRCDESVKRLLDGLSSILPLVAMVEKATQLPHLKSTVKSLLDLIEEASQFIIDYHSTGSSVPFNSRKKLTSSNTGQTARVQTISMAEERVDKLLEKLQDLKAEFDRCINVQLLLDGHRALLDKLNPVAKARYDPSRACLDGTRVEIVEDIVGWCKRSDASDRLLWVHGQAGLGKSTIAASVCQQLESLGLLACSFFCKRDDPEQRDPQRLLTTIIRSLAHQHDLYAKALVAVIQQDSSICGSPVETQYNKLIVDLFKQPELSTSNSEFVVVVDALDECGDNDTRRKMLGQLYGMTRSVAWLKIVVTSRPDRDTTEYFDRAVSNHDYSTRNVHNYEASDDIQAFVDQRLRESGKYDLLPADTSSKLAKMADGLFIWAQTACEFILNTKRSPSARLRTLFQTSQPTTLDTLYTTTIEASMDSDGEDERELIRQCLGAIIVCSKRRPLSISTLCGLLGNRVDEGEMESVVRSLGAVLYTDSKDGGAVRVYHPSFADYMTSPARSKRFCVDIPKLNSKLAEGCLETMSAQLRFNICGIGSSYMRNKDMPSLEKSVEKAIKDGLRYSCEYWTNHLVEAEEDASISPGGDLLSQILDGPRILYWVETLSLIGKLDTALPSLRDLNRWCEGTPQLRVIYDLERFVQTFYTPISESTPHLYLSGLAFLPMKTSLAEMWQRHFGQTMKLERGMQEAWSSLRHCIVIGSGVNSVAFSPDSHRIVSGSSDNAVRVWDADTGALIGESLTDHSHLVTSVAFSPDGHRTVSGSDDKTVRVWDADTGAPIGEPFTGHSHSVTSVAFSPDSHRIVSGSDDQTVRLWDADTGAPIGEPLT